MAAMGITPAYDDMVVGNGRVLKRSGATRKNAPGMRDICESGDILDQLGK